MRTFKFNKLFFGISALFAISNAFAANLNQSDIIVIHSIKHDISIPLRHMPATSLSGPSLNAKIENLFKRENPLKIYAFQGVGESLGGYAVTTPASQVSGAAGLTQYVQWVDPDIAVFNKMNGALEVGFPKPGNLIWSGFGGPCETQNVGAPNVKYDQIANRWVLTRQSYDDPNIGPFYQCVAVSTTDDATGSYYRYAFPMDSLSNFGKLGLWSDAYYIALTMFGPVSNGPRACALERDQMLMGNDASAQCKQLTFTDPAPLIPADLGGTMLPPTGMPGFFFSIKPPQALSFYKFHVDWTTPANTFIDSGTDLSVNPFILPCASTDGKNCVVQPDTNNRLDLLGDSFASRLVYRRFADYGTFTAVHTIQGDAPKLSPALRWYELHVMNDPDANPTISQQATYEPDSKARFTGSIAIDKFENIALGYTVSSTAVHPSPELGYHNAGMTPDNTLTTQALYTGIGSQTNISMWTNYSAMSVDPVDSCTFWYTSQYLQNSGSFNWSTVITHFKLAGC